MEVVVEDDGVRFVVVVDDVLFVEPSVMFLAIPEGRLLDDTCPPRMGGHLAAATGSSSFSDRESSLLSSSVRLLRSLYSFQRFCCCFILVLHRNHRQYFIRS